VNRHNARVALERRAAQPLNVRVRALSRREKRRGGDAAAMCKRVNVLKQGCARRA
jgi:hypothetical protein